MAPRIHQNVMSMTREERDALHFLLYDLDMNIPGGQWPEGMDTPNDVREVRRHLTSVLGKIGALIDRDPGPRPRGRPRKVR